MPMKTRPTVTMPRYSPRTRTAAGRDDEADQRGGDAGARQPDPHRQLKAPRVGTRLAAEVGRRVGAGAHEEGVAERDLAGDPGEQVQPEGGDGEDHRLGGEADPVGVAEEADERELVDDRQVERQQHQRATPSSVIRTRCVHVGKIDVSDW